VRGRYACAARHLDLGGGHEEAVAEDAVEAAAEGLLARDRLVPERRVADADLVALEA
jgi:hypothetical protein